MDEPKIPYEVVAYHTFEDRPWQVGDRHAATAAYVDTLEALRLVRRLDVGGPAGAADPAPAAAAEAPAVKAPRKR